MTVYYGKAPSQWIQKSLIIQTSPNNLPTSHMRVCPSVGPLVHPSPVPLFFFSQLWAILDTSISHGNFDEGSRTYILTYAKCMHRWLNKLKNELFGLLGAGRANLFLDLRLWHHKLWRNFVTLEDDPRHPRNAYAYGAFLWPVFRRIVSNISYSRRTSIWKNPKKASIFDNISVVFWRGVQWHRRIT